jgi:hypothetical protein
MFLPSKSDESIYGNLKQYTKFMDKVFEFIDEIESELKSRTELYTIDKVNDIFKIGYFYFNKTCRYEHENNVFDFKLIDKLREDLLLCIGKTKQILYLYPFLKIYCYKYKVMKDPLDFTSLINNILDPKYRIDDLTKWNKIEFNNRYIFLAFSFEDISIAIDCFLIYRIDRDELTNKFGERIEPIIDMIDEYVESENQFKKKLTEFNKNDLLDM